MVEGMCLSPEPEAVLILEAPFAPLEKPERKPALGTLHTCGADCCGNGR